MGTKTPLQEFARQKASIRNRNVSSAIAEFLGTFVLMLFGVGAGCQATILAASIGAFGAWLMPLLGGVLGLMVAIFIVGGVSGAHVNPAVTLALGVSGGISWVKVPIYWAAQFVGGYLGSGTAYLLYMQTLIPEGSPCASDLGQGLCPALAGVFAPLPKSDVGIAFLDQTIGTGLLVLLVMAVLDSRNMKVPVYCYAPIFAATVIAIRCAFGINAGGALNPAADISARMMAITVGFDAKHVFLYGAGTANEEHYWLAPMFGPLMGGIVGSLIYIFGVAAHLQDDNTPELLEPYVPNRFNVQSQPNYQPQYQSSQKSYAPQPTTNSYRHV